MRWLYIYGSWRFEGSLKAVETVYSFLLLCANFTDIMAPVRAVWTIKWLFLLLLSNFSQILAPEGAVWAIRSNLRRYCPRN